MAARIAGLCFIYIMNVSQFDLYFAELNCCPLKRRNRVQDRKMLYKANQTKRLYIKELSCQSIAQLVIGYPDRENQNLFAIQLAGIANE